ncbi:unnamed protein product [Clavelina lepadiformis]
MSNVKNELVKQAVIGRGIEYKRSYAETEDQCYSKQTRIYLETSSSSLLEMCEGLAQLARNEENSAAILNAPEFPKYIITILESEDEMERKSALQLIRNMCLSKKTQKKFKKQTTLVLFLQKMRINDPDKLAYNLMTKTSLAISPTEDLAVARHNTKPECICIWNLSSMLVRH